LFELKCDSFDGLNIFGRWFEGNVFAILLEGEAFVGRLLMGDDGEVEECRWIIGLRFERGAKAADGFVRATALMGADAAEPIQRFGVLRAEMESVLKGFFCGSEIVYAQLRGAELEERFEGIRAAQCVGDEFSFGSIIFLLIEVEAAEVKMSFAEVVIDEERAPVGFFGFAELASVVISEAEIVPRQSIGGYECDGEFEFFNGLAVITFVDEFFALEEGFGTGGSATGCQEQEKENERRVK